MKFTSGYYFFESREGGSACGYVLLRYGKNAVKVQCVAENIPAAFGNSALLRFIDPLDPQKPFTLGRMVLKGDRELLRGEQHFIISARAFSPASGKYEQIELVSEQTRAQILKTAPPPRKEPKPEPPRPPFDPFHTTNPAYRWSRAVRPEQLRQELTRNRILPGPDVLEGIRKAFEAYSHILLGRYQPQGAEKQYFLLGLPGRQPPEDPDKIYRWINKCVELPEYPEFDGYRLYYYDTETGAAVKAVVRA